MVPYFQIALGNLYFHLIIAIPLFFIFSWLITKHRQSIKRPNIIAAIGTILTAPLLYRFLVFLYLFLLFGNDVNPDQDFDPIVWKEDASNRYTMINDLLEEDQLSGFQKRDIVKLLGNPNGDTLDFDGLISWNYDMGNHPWGLGIKGHNLIVYFSNNNVDSLVHKEWID